MAEDLIGYSRLVENALRGVVKGVLRQVAVEGLPGEHHFYITFTTDHPSVEIAESLKARYPSEMTIVLQHQYWDLEVDDVGFSIALSFNGVTQHLRVGWDAIKLFADPAVEFGLQFNAGESADAEGAEAAPEPEDATDEERPEGGAQIVTLDRFRKK